MTSMTYKRDIDGLLLAFGAALEAVPVPSTLGRPAVLVALSSAAAVYVVSHNFVVSGAAVKDFQEDFAQAVVAAVGQRCRAMDSNERN